MKVTIIQSSLYLTGTQVFKSKKMWLKGLTLCYLSALIPGDIDVEIYDEVVDEIDFDTKTDLVMITCMGVGMIRALEISDEFRMRRRKVVIGGYPVSFNTEIALKHADAIVVGEAENIVIKLIKDYKRGQLRGVYEGELHNLKNLPVPRYDLLEETKRGPFLPVQATRGCPNICTYCSITIFYRHIFRKRPVLDVLRDIEGVKRLGTNKVFFVDDNIAADQKYAEDLFKALIPMKIKWFSQSTIQIANNEKLLELAYESGCLLLSIGIDSIVQENQFLIHKNFNNVSRFKDQIERIHQAGIHINTHMIFGFDHDKEGIFKDSVEFLLGNNIALPKLYLLTPVKGTPIFTKIAKENRFLQRSPENFISTRVNIKLQFMDQEQLQEFFWNSYQELYTLKNIFHRLFLSPYKNFWIKAVLFWINLSYRANIKKRQYPGMV